MPDRKQSKYSREISIVLVEIGRNKQRELGSALISGTQLSSASKSARGLIAWTPQIPLIEAWVEACGVRLDEFFTKVLAEAAKPRARPTRLK